MSIIVLQIAVSFQHKNLQLEYLSSIYFVYQNQLFFISLQFFSISEIHIHCEPNYTCHQPPNLRDQEISLDPLEESAINSFGTSMIRSYQQLWDIYDDQKFLGSCHLFFCRSPLMQKKNQNLYQLHTLDCDIEQNNINLVQRKMYT